MPRPRYEADAVTARDKLKDSFWKLLEKIPYQDLTVRAIAADAGLNKNTFYYHYGCLDDLARDAMSDILDPGFYRMMLKALEHGNEQAAAIAPDDFAQRVDRACIVSGNNSSAELRSMLKAALGNAWQQAFGFDAEALDLQERLLYEFALGGVLSLLAFRADSGRTFSVADAAQTDAAQHMIDAVRNLGRNR